MSSSSPSGDSRGRMPREPASAAPSWSTLKSTLNTLPDSIDLRDWVYHPSLLPVPPVLVQLRDRQNRLVFSWTTKADKGRLKPGEEASINESRIDIPQNAENLSLTFVQ